MQSPRGQRPVDQQEEVNRTPDVPDRTGRSRILRAPEVSRRCGISRVTIWRLERAGLFPVRRHLTDHLVGWLEHEIDDWIATRRTIR